MISQSPFCGEITIFITFDSVKSVWLSVQVLGGPQVNMRLCANVIIPDLQVSTDVIEFGEVKCGECHIVSIQLNNYQAVHCEWSTAPAEHTKKPVTKQIVSRLCICIIFVMMKRQVTSYWSEHGVLFVSG